MTVNKTVVDRLKTFTVASFVLWVIWAITLSALGFNMVISSFLVPVFFGLLLIVATVVQKIIHTQVSAPTPTTASVSVLSQNPTHKPAENAQTPPPIADVQPQTGAAATQTPNISRIPYCIRLAYKLLVTVFKNLIFFVFLVLSASNPKLFAITTFIFSLLIFGKLEHDKSLHDRNFYFNLAPRKYSLAFIGFLIKIEVLVKATCFALLALILFAGTNHDRISATVSVFLATIYLGAFILWILEKLLKFNMERWGYLRFSLLLGIAFSFLVATIEGQGFWEIGKTLFAKRFDLERFNFNESVELVFNLSYQLNNIIERLFTSVLGESLGKIITLILNLNIAYGFVIYLYVILYFRLLRFRLRRKAPDNTQQSEASGKIGAIT